MDNCELIEEIDNIQLIHSHLLKNPETCQTILQSLKNGFTVLTQNIRSINKNLDQFNVFLKRLNFMPDVIVLTESRLNQNSPLYYINNYDYHCSKHFINQNDGIVVFTKKGLNVHIIEPSFKEANCLVIQINQIYTIIALYRSPSFRTLDNFLISLEDTICKYDNETCIVTGDININIIDSNIKLAGQYLDLMANYGYISGHNFPTHDRTNLDHMFIKSAKKSEVAVCLSDVTDHDTVMCSIQTVTATRCPNIKRVTKIDFTTLAENIKNSDWTDVLNQKDVTVALNKFTTTINTLTIKNTSTKTQSNAHYIKLPWMTLSILNCARKRDRLHQKARKYPKDIHIQNKYKQYRNYCNNVIQNLKQEYEKKLLLESKGNSKNTWNVIKKICNINSQKSTSLDLIESSPKESLNKVNTYFTTVGKNLANAILTQVNKSEQDLANEVPINNALSPLNSFFMTPTTFDEVVNIINTLKPKSAAGIDCISNKILIQNKIYVATPLVHICNLSISSGSVPFDLKAANVCPIHKAGDKKEPSNYRPISLLTAISKIIEKIVNKRLLNYLEQGKYLASNQYGFRKQISTEDAVTDLVNTIVEKLDNKYRCTGVFIDLAKAFDTVSRPILLKKLEAIGIRGSALEWFSSYLSDRFQRVKMNDQSSDFLNVDFGVPQGSVLGPTLFLIYINDLCKLNLKQAKIFTYADDTAIVFYASTWKQVVDVAQDGLKRVAFWMQNNLLTLNISKTKYINFHVTNHTAPKVGLDIKLHTCSRSPSTTPCTCSLLEEVHHIKYLGVTVDRKLTWVKHIETMCTRIRKLTHIFRKLRSVASKDTINLVYNSLCESIFSYCITAWGACCKTAMISLERVQRMILKVAHRKPFRYPTIDLYELCSVLTVRQIYILSVLIKFHRRALFLKKKRSNSSRRYRPTWVTPPTRTIFAERFYPYIAPFLYNRVNTILNIYMLNKHSCKKTLKKWLQSLNYNDTELIFNR